MTRVLSSGVWIVFLRPQRDSERVMSIFMIRSIPFLWNTCKRV